MGGSPRGLRGISSEEAFSLVDLLAALMLLGVAIFGLAGAMGIGIRAVGLSSQRQAAAEVGQARVEDIRRLPFKTVALSQAPTPASDPTDPDSGLGQGFDGNLQYNVQGGPGSACAAAPPNPCEDVYVDAGGTVPHIQTTALGLRTIRTYTYVTLGPQGNRRVIVVSRWSFQTATLVGGVSSVARYETLVGPGAVGNLPEQDPVGVPNGCGADQTPPNGTVKILVNEQDVDFTNVTNTAKFSAVVSASDPCNPLKGQLSSNGSTWGDGTTTGSFIDLVSGSPREVPVTLQLRPGDNKVVTVYARFQDAVPNVSNPVFDTVVVDTVAPTAPGNLTKGSCTTTGKGNNAVSTVTLTWSQSTDTAPGVLAGYRLYQNNSFVQWIPAGTLTATDTFTSGNASYTVTAVDKASNESSQSNSVTFSVNQKPCK